MRTVRPLFARDAEFHRSPIDRLCKLGKPWSSLNSNPKDPRRSYSWKETVGADSDFKRAAFDPSQTRANDLNPLGCLFSDKLQSNVQRIRMHPPRFWRKPLNTFDKAFDPGANRRVKIDANKYSHFLGIAFYKSARRIISKACRLENRRMRVRSPGKLRSTTCVPSSPASAT